MRFLLHCVWSFLLMVGGAQGQDKKPAPPVPAVSPAVTAGSTTTVEEFYPLPPERKAQIRELQYQIDQAQIRIEQLKQQQIMWNDSIATIATDFARIKNLDVMDFDLDQVNLRLTKKKLSEKK